jgi:hypothetical protein
MLEPQQPTASFSRPPHDEPIEAYVERRYLECLWMPDILEPLSNLVPSLRRVIPSKEWSPPLGPHPLHVVLDEQLLDLKQIHKKYRHTIPALLKKEGDAQDAEEACIWYAWTHAQSDDAEQPVEGADQNDKWTKKWLHEAEKREYVTVKFIQLAEYLRLYRYLTQILLRMLKLTLPPPPAAKRKRRKNNDAENDAPAYIEVIAGL